MGTFPPFLSPWDFTNQIFFGTWRQSGLLKASATSRARRLASTLYSAKPRCAELKPWYVWCPAVLKPCTVTLPPSWKQLLLGGNDGGIYGGSNSKNVVSLGVFWWWGSEGYYFVNATYHPLTNKALWEGIIHHHDPGLDPLNTPLRRYSDSPQTIPYLQGKLRSYIGFWILDTLKLFHIKTLLPNHILNNHPGIRKGTSWKNNSYFGISSYLKFQGCIPFVSIYIGPCLNTGSQWIANVKKWVPFINTRTDFLPSLFRGFFQPATSIIISELSHEKTLVLSIKLVV